MAQYLSFYSLLKYFFEDQTEQSINYLHVRLIQKKIMLLSKRSMRFRSEAIDGGE